MRITEASSRLGISPRMLRYRETLGLLPAFLARSATGRHRQFDAGELDAIALGLAIEQRYDISPAALSFGLRVLTDPAARAEVAELGRRIGRVRPLPAMAMDFEKERAIRLLGTPAAVRTRTGPRSRPAPPTASRPRSRPAPSTASRTTASAGRPVALTARRP
jgi:MerR family transcriptional regulator, copper efflux regulator